MSETIYPKIILGSTNPDSKAIIKIITDQLKAEKISPNIVPINLFEPEILTDEVRLRQFSDVDYFIMIIEKSDLSELENYEKEQSRLKRDYFIFLFSFLLSQIGKRRLLIARPARTEIPVISDQKGLELTSMILDKKNLSSSLRIFGNRISRTIQELGIRDKQTFSQSPEEIIDWLTHYSIKIYNPEGDTEIKRKIMMEALQDNVQIREHRIFSDTTPSTFKALALKAYEENGRNLSIETQFDSPSKKEFNVRFRDQLSKGDQLTYSYEFHWKGFFADQKSNFSVKGTAKKILFDLVLPFSWDLMYLEIKEKRLDGIKPKTAASAKKLREEEDGDFIRYCYQLEEFDPKVLELELNWSVQYKTQNRAG